MIDNIEDISSSCLYDSSTTDGHAIPFCSFDFDGVHCFCIVSIKSKTKQDAVVFSSTCVMNAKRVRRQYKPRCYRMNYKVGQLSRDSNRAASSISLNTNVVFVVIYFKYSKTLEVHPIHCSRSNQNSFVLSFCLIIFSRKTFNRLKCQSTAKSIRLIAMKIMKILLFFRNHTNLIFLWHGHKMPLLCSFQ